MRVLIIGLDGATWNVLDDSLVGRYMPNLQRLKTSGCWGILESTEPPVTPAAWTTCFTGCQPHTHKVFGFENYSFRDNLSRMSNATDCSVPTMWEDLSSQGYKVASVNVPWTYPCRKVNGITVAGHCLPNTQVEFTYPDNFKNELLEVMPDYNAVARWEKAADGDSAKLEANISRVERCFEQRLQTAEMVAKKCAADLMMVHFQSLDMIQHHLWTYVDKKSRDSHGSRRNRLFRMFTKLDSAIGGLLALADSSKSTVVVVSDHGFCRMLGKINVNMLLYDWNYLKLKTLVGLAIRRLRRNLRYLSFKPKSSLPFELRTTVDWKRSKAMAMNTEMHGRVYLNVRGRNMKGCVEPGAEYDSIINALRERFLQVRNPATGEQIFARVTTHRELYDCENADVEKLGDLILVPKKGYSLTRSISKKCTRIELCREDSLAGCHCHEGIYIISGPNVRAGRNRQAHIVDICPTVYAVLGAKAPTYLDGNVLQDAFSQGLNVQYSSSEKQPHPPEQERQRFSDGEEKAIHQQLADLGYID